jgi:hypothetical protein
MSISDKLTIVAENVPKVFEAGEKAGAKSEYNDFWKQYQSNGVVYGTAYMFAFGGWNDTNFKPKYSMSGFTNAGNMFNTCGVTDLKAALERQGVTFDFSKVTNLANAFAYSKLTVIPTVNAKSAVNLSSAFAYSNKIHTIEKLILKDDGSQTFPSTFLNCSSLANIVLEGVIGQDINFKQSTKLTKDSINNIMSCLSTTSSGKTLTLSLTAVNNAFETTEGAADGSASSEWAALKATKSNWTVSLI